MHETVGARFGHRELVVQISRCATFLGCGWLVNGGSVRGGW